MTKTVGQLGGLGGVTNADIERGPRGTVQIANNITSARDSRGFVISASEMRMRTYAHELGNLLAARLAGSIEYATQTYGTPGGETGSLTGQIDYDPGARFEACAIGRFVS